MNDLLSRLQEARSMEERDWLITQDLLTSLPPDLVRAALVAALPRYFDTAVLGAVLELEDARQVYADLQSLPFVERHGPEAHRVHELTRAGMLTYYWRTPPHWDEALALHRRLWHHFAERGDHLAALYHRLPVELNPALDDFKQWLHDAETFHRCAEAETLTAAVAEQERMLSEQQQRGLSYYLIKPELLRQQGEDTYRISGTTYHLYPLPGWADDLPAVRAGGASYFVLPVLEDGWVVPEARVGDYVLVRKEWMMTRGGSGVVWESASGWSEVEFRRGPDGKIRFYRHPPKIIGGAALAPGDDPVGKVRGYIIALLKPAEQGDCRQAWSYDKPQDRQPK